MRGRASDKEASWSQVWKGRNGEMVEGVVARSSFEVVDIEKVGSVVMQESPSGFCERAIIFQEYQHAILPLNLENLATSSCRPPLSSPTCCSRDDQPSRPLLETHLQLTFNR